MPVTIDAPLAWEVAAGDDELMLDELQANIVKGHVRDALAILFLHFDDQAEARTFLRDELAPLVKSAKTHLEEVRDFKAPPHTPGTVYVGVGLTKAGYDALGVTATPADAAFVRGMKDPLSRQTLLDPPLSVWEPQYREEIHAIVLIGDKGDATVCTMREQVLAALPAGVSVLGEETGMAQLNAAGNGIEHFGYVDGRSQPLFLKEDIFQEVGADATTAVWDPSFPLERVIVPDPAASDPGVHFGSYFVYRKLEQNVRRFKEAEEGLADSLGFAGDDRDRAGAMIVGRFRDGTPITAHERDGVPDPTKNDFDYDADAGGSKCPYHAHIRKTNPRGSGGFESEADERAHIMARRGQTYGERADDPNDPTVPLSQRPTKGVGLLFMAFNTVIDSDADGSQFDFTQRRWANGAGFPRVPEGAAAPELDDVMGQGVRRGQTYPNAWDKHGTQKSDPIPQAVSMKGGEYFFMPSRAFLREL